MVRIIENYLLHEIVGEGAYGKVYRATNVKVNDKEFAVKVIEIRKFKENKKLEECTVNEINILSSIGDHDHIIKFIEMLKTPNNFYFIYEFCNGGNLEVIVRKGPMAEKDALLIFKQLIEAFQVLNKYNIMHRDLKPDNIFFNNGVVKLGDFGFCKSLEKAEMTKTMLGSPIYMAPEILRGEIYSTKADIWSLGVVLYEMVYGVCPFESGTIPKLLEMLKEIDLFFPESIYVSQETKKLLKNMLTKDSTKRIEWMALLNVNINIEGRIIASGKPERLSLVGENSFGTEVKEVSTPSANSNSPPSGSTTSSWGQVYNGQKAYLENEKKEEVFYKKEDYSKPEFNESTSFFKKKTAADSMPEKKKKQEIPLNEQGKKSIMKEHLEALKGINLAITHVKINDNNSSLYSYLCLKKSEEKLMKLIYDNDCFLESKEFNQIFNEELKEVTILLSKFNINESLSKWKELIKATANFNQNTKNFYSTILYLTGEIPQDTLTHAQMQIEIRNRIY